MLLNIRDQNEPSKSFYGLLFSPTGMAFLVVWSKNAHLKQRYYFKKQRTESKLY